MFTLRPSPCSSTPFILPFILYSLLPSACLPACLPSLLPFRCFTCHTLNGYQLSLSSHCYIKSLRSPSPTISFSVSLPACLYARSSAYVFAHSTSVCLLRYLLPLLTSHSVPLSFCLTISLPVCLSVCLIVSLSVLQNAWVLDLTRRIQASY